MFRLFLAKVASLFFMHPDAHIDEQKDLLKDKSFMRFMLRNDTGLLLLVFLIGALACFVLGVMHQLIMFESMGAICVWLIIRAVGLHHGSWRRRMLEETRGESYRVSYDEALRYGRMPHYARIASVLLILMTTLVAGRTAWDAIDAHQGSSRVPAAREVVSSTSTTRDAEPPSAGILDARIGEFCTVQVDGEELVGIYQLQGDALICVDPD